MRAGLAMVLVGLVGVTIFEVLAAFNRISSVTRDTNLRGPVSFVLVGLVTFLIAWKKKAS